MQAAKTPKEKKNAENKYRQNSVKSVLVKMFCGKCGYCESKITHVDYGHIEHYRPKSGPQGRPNLTFVWSNMLLACGVCNGAEYKGVHFPEASGGGPIINPCAEDPVSHFDFHYDAATKLASVYGITTRGKTTEKLLGLNRADLRIYRSNYVHKLIVLATIAVSNAEAAQLLKEAKESDSPYAAFARALL